MIFFLGKELLGTKAAFLSFLNIFGIGWSYSIYLCRKVGISNKVKLQYLQRERLLKISRYVSLEGVIGAELIRAVNIDIKVKVQKKSYQGMRHVMLLPVNGQRTKNNAKTAKKRSLQI